MEFNDLQIEMAGVGKLLRSDIRAFGEHTKQLFRCVIKTACFGFLNFIVSPLYYLPQIFILRFQNLCLRNKARYFALHFAYQRYKLGLLKGEKVNLFALCADGINQTQKIFQKLRHERLQLLIPNLKWTPEKGRLFRHSGA